MSLIFKEEGHRYYWNDIEIPSVTTIIESLTDFFVIPAHVLKAAAERGTAVHLATELYDLDDLDEKTLDPILIPYLEAWKKFLADTGFVSEHIELRVYHDKYRYAGTLDRAGLMGKKKVLLDIKSGTVTGPQFDVQTSAYYEATKAMGIGDYKYRYDVQLKPDGTYRLHPHTDRMSFSVFLSCLQIYNWRMKWNK